MSLQTFTRPPPRTDDYRELSAWYDYTAQKIRQTLTSPVQGSEIGAGVIAASHLGAGSVTLAAFYAGLRPVQVVSSLPSLPDANYPSDGSVIMLTTDGKLYRNVAGSWVKAIPTTDLIGTITNTQIADDSISTPKLQANSVTGAKILAGEVSTNHLAADSVVAGKIAAGAVTVTKLGAGAVQTSKIYSGSYTAPGDNNTTPGVGMKLDVDNGKIEAYGNSHSLGGNLVSSDGNYMLSIGRYLTATGLGKRYPLHNATNFTEDGRTYGYSWNGSAWVEIFSIGNKQLSSDYYALHISRTGVRERGIYVKCTGADAKGIYTETTSSGSAIEGWTSGALYAGYFNNSFNSAYATGVAGVSTYGVGGFFAGTTKGPVTLYPSSSASAPSHSADKGTFWVTSAGKLYINTDGSTTWELVGSQT